MFSTSVFFGFMSSDLSFTDILQNEICEAGLNPTSPSQSRFLSCEIEDNAGTYNPLEAAPKQIILKTEKGLLMETGLQGTANVLGAHDIDQSSKSDIPAENLSAASNTEISMCHEYIVELSTLCLDACSRLVDARKRIVARLDEFALMVNKEHLEKHAKQNLSIAREMEELELMKDMEEELIRAKAEIESKDAIIANLNQLHSRPKSPVSSGSLNEAQSNPSPSEIVVNSEGLRDFMGNSSLVRELEELELMKDMELELVRARDAILLKDAEISSLKNYVAGLNRDSLDNIQNEISFRNEDLSEDQACNAIRCARCESNESLEELFQNILWKDDDYDRIHEQLKEREKTIASLHVMMQTSGRAHDASIIEEVTQEDPNKLATQDFFESFSQNDLKTFPCN